MPKLPKNMIRRKDRPGYWYRGAVDGVVRQLSLGTEYPAALRRLRSLKTDGLPQQGLTVAEAATRWLEVYVATARGVRSVKLAAQRVRDYIVPHVGHLLLPRVTADHVRTFRLRLEGGHLSLQSVKHVLSDLRCLLTWCEGSGLVDRSPFPRRVMPRIQERPPDRLNDEEVAALVSLLDPYGFICRFGLATGLRWGELSRAQSADLQNGALVVHHTKSGKVRRVPLSQALQEELRYRVGRIIPVRDSWGFTSQVRRRSGIERFHPHQMRHTFGCLWLEAGGSLAALQEVMGHASIVTTQRYARLGEAHVRAEAERLEGRLSPKLSPAVHPSSCTG